MSNQGQNDQIENEIQELERVLQDMEDTSPDYLDPSLKDIRHFVIFVHSRLEQSLQLLIGQDLIWWDQDKENRKESIQFFANLWQIFEKMEFWGKIKICQERNLIQGALIGNLEKINKYRIVFSHPAAYHEEIQKYKDRGVCLQILKDLVSVIEEMDKIFAKDRRFQNHLIQHET